MHLIPRTRSDENCTLRFQGLCYSKGAPFSLIPMVCAKHVAGVAADISHVIIKSKVTGSQLADDELRLEPTGASFVFIPAVVA